MRKKYVGATTRWQRIVAKHNRHTSSYPFDLALYHRPFH